MIHIVKCVVLPFECKLKLMPDLIYLLFIINETVNQHILILTLSFYYKFLLLHILLKSIDILLLCSCCL